MDVSLANLDSTGVSVGATVNARDEESVPGDTVEQPARKVPLLYLNRLRNVDLGDLRPKTRGRPRGTGPRQLEKARAASAGAIPVPIANFEFATRHPVCRPRKKAPLRAFSVHMGQRIIPGIPIRTRSAAEPNENNPNNLHPIHVPKHALIPYPHACVQFLDDTIPPDDDEDTYSGLLNDGVGDADGDDSSDDDGDGPGSDSSSTAYSATVSTWLDIQFKARLVEANDRDRQGVPALYRKHLANRKHFDLNDLTPEKLFHAQFFLWDPAALVPIPCPLCQTALYRHAVTPAAVSIWTVHSTSLAIDIVARVVYTQNPT
ncbi:hypothetical protein C8R43DRAFT_1152909 [Mycena crocata]|nr:hypothetical protein C8R43DRAFT_1152909 [Mycena crocata]